MNQETMAMRKIMENAVVITSVAPSEFDAMAVTPPKHLKQVSIADVFTNPSPAPQFVWDGYLPNGMVSMLGAHGGTGKSTIGLMLNVSVALGQALFEVATSRCKTLFVSLEDSEQVVRHRLAFICKAWNINPQDLESQMCIVDGTDYPELFSAESRGDGCTTATYSELKKLIEAEGFGMVLIDNASDAYGGDEIQRRQVRAFIRSLGKIAAATNCAVLLLAHVDKNTSRNRNAEGGEGYSGSTAWHNSVRSRMFMTRKDDGSLTLEHQKSNHGKMRDPVSLEWPDGGLPQLVAGQSSGASEFLSMVRGKADDDRAIAVLKLIAEYESRGQFCSPQPQARNNVHAMLRSDQAFQRLKLNVDGCKRIITQCQRANWLESVDYRSPDRKARQRWGLTQDGYAFAGLAAPTAPTAPTCHEGADSACGAPTAPTYAGGVGDRARTGEGAEGAFS